MAPQNPRDMRDYMRTLERLTAQQRAMPALISNTIKDVIEEEGKDKARHPAAPIELAPQSAFYKDLATGRQRVRLSLDFPDVIFNTDGSTASIQQYELWGRDETDPAEDVLADEKPWAIQSTSAESSFRVDGYVPGRLWRLRARALGTDSILPGEWSEEITVQMVKDSVPPPQATAPVAVASRGVITVTWDGGSVSGPMPGDFLHAILAQGSAASPTKEVARFGREGGLTVIAGVPYNTPQFFRVRAVDESGNLGPWSVQVTAVTKPLVDIDVIISEIDAGKTTIKNAEKAILSSGAQLGKKLQDADEALAATEKKLTGPGGLTERLVSAEELLADAGSLVYATGQTLRQKLAASDSLISSAQGQLTTLKDVTLPALNSSLSAATGRITAAEGQITAANSALGTAKTDIAAAVKDIGANKLIMDGAVTRLGAAEGEITSAKGRLTAAEGKVTTLQNTTIPALNTALESAGSRLDASDKLVKETFPAQLSALERQSAATDALIAQALASGQSLITNGNFEAGMTGWQTVNGVEVLAAAARSGTGGMRLTPRGTNLWPSSKEIATSTGRVYYAEMWVRRGGTDTAYAGTAIAFIPQSRNAAGVFATPTVRAKLDDGTLVRIADIPTDRFVRVSAEFTIDQVDANRVTFAPWFFRNDNGNFYDIDDIMVIDITEAKKVQAGLTAAETEIANAKKEITANKGVMDGAVTRLGAAEGEITSAKGRLTAAEGKVTTLQNTTIPALNTALDGATGRLTTAEGKITKAEGTLSTTTSDLTKLTNRVSPLESGINTLNTTTIPALTSSINGKNQIVRSEVTPGSAASYVLGDRWEKWSTLGPGGKLQKTWRHTGDVWREELLDASYLPLVDIGAGTFGTLSGGRLTVKSVSAAQILIGFGENLLADPTFEDPEISARRANSAANWSWVQDILGGSYMTTEWATTADLSLGNSSSSELFPIDPTGAMAFTVDAEGPDVLQVYLQVKYADGASNTGPYVKSLPLGAGPGRRTATVQYDFAGPSLSSTGSPPVSARPILRRKTSSLTGATKVYSVRFAPATKGEMVVNGTITGDHVAAESVAAKIGSFLSLTTDQLVAGSAVLGDAVAQKIAAATASFQKVDAKNLTVTGTSSLSTVVAQRLAAETGVFMELTTDQLVAGTASINTLVAQKIAAGTAAFQKADISNLTAGTANMTQAVIDKLVANTASFQRVTVDNITATATASLNSVVAQRIAAGTASFQTVDVKNLFVTGTASMNEVVAKRIASETGVFISLTTDQLVAGTATINTLVAQKIAAGTAAFQKADISNLTAGTANMTQAVIDKLVANTASFQKVTVDNITATSTANLNSVVAQRIAAGTATFQTVDVKNLFVTGTASMDDVVAKRIASETGAFIKLSVDQLTVVGTANMATAVADKMFANIFASNKLTTNQLLVGKGENLIAWLANASSADVRTIDPHVVPSGSTFTFDTTGGRSGGPHGLLNNPAVVSGTRREVFRFQPAAQGKNGLYQFDVEPGTKYKASVWIRAGGSYTTYPSVALHSQTYVGDGAYEAGSAIFGAAKTVSWSWQEVTHEFTTGANAATVLLRIYMDQPGVLRLDDPMLVKDGASLIATGGIVADHITASTEMSAKIGTFLKLNVNQLVATGTSTLATAVIENLWTNVVRSRSITTDMLTVGSGPNGVLDPFFESDSTKAIRKARSGNWGGWSRNSTLNLNWYGASGLSTTSTNSFYFDAADVDEPGTMIAVEPGQKWRLKVKYNAVGSGPRATARFLNKDGTKSYSASYWTTDTGGGNAYGPTGVQDLERIFEVPDTAAYIIPAVQFPTGTTAAYIYGGASFVNMATSSLIVDGAITAKKLTITEEMTAALLKAKKVVAGEIDVNSLAADSVFVGLLDAKIIVSDVFSGKVFSGGTFTGSVFQTTTSSSRGVQFDKNGIQAWSSTGVKTFGVDAATGALSAVGSFATVPVDGMSVKITTATVSGRLMPQMSFEFPGATNDPMVFTEFNAPGVPANFGHGTLALQSARLTSTAGWASLQLGVECVAVLQRQGNYDKVGFETDRQYMDVRGMLRNNGGYPNSQFRTGEAGGLSGNLGIGSSTVYTVNIVPAPAGTIIRPFVTINNNGNPFAVQTYDAWVSSFKVRIHNMGSAASNLFGINWFTVSST